MKNDLRTIYHSHDMIARVNNKKVQKFFKKLSRLTTQYRLLFRVTGFPELLLFAPLTHPTPMATSPTSPVAGLLGLRMDNKSVLGSLADILQKIYQRHVH